MSMGIETVRGDFVARRIARGRFAPYRGAAGCSVDGCPLHARWRVGRRPICDPHRAAALRAPRRASVRADVPSRSSE
jgi:hypothetical protein